VKLRAANRATKWTRGYSLVELLVVLVILALLVGLVAPRVISYLGRARSQTADVQVVSFESALDLLLIDVGRYPSEEEGLATLMQNIADMPGWSGPYLKSDELPTDPWGRTYRYSLAGDGQAVRVFSLGADDAEGGEGENRDIGR